MATPLPPEIRLAIYDRHCAGESLQDIATDLGIHYETARKFWRIGRLQGREAVMPGPRKRPGLARGLSPAARQRLAERRAEHPTWGVPYLRQQLLADPQLAAQERAALPSLSVFYRHLHAVEDRPFKHRLKQVVPVTPLVKQAEHAHHLWQVDMKERFWVKGLSARVTVVNMRDIHSSVTTGAVIFALKRTETSLCQADIQAACRSSFARWGLPDRLRTDLGSCFVGTAPQTGFPSYLTLWLAGLGITHETIAKGKVTQNGCIERFNRTYNNLVLRDGPFESLQELQRVSETTIEFLNTTYPSKAGRCEGQPPLRCHPEASQPRRSYRPHDEAQWFDLDRVDTRLGQYRWQRRADMNGRASLGRTDYHLGRQNKGLVFDVTFDPSNRHFLFQSPDGTVTVRRPARGLDASDIVNIRDSEGIRLRKKDKQT